jgi:hypothetical protein
VVVLAPFAGQLVSLWGAVPTGAAAAVHAPAAAFLAWRAVGAPVTVLLLVLQVGVGGWCGVKSGA